MTDGNATLSAPALHDSLCELGMTDLVGLPDNATAALFDAVSADPRADLRTVAREGEAFAIASGLWLGGRRPVACIQATGLFESGDSLRGTASRMGVPLLCLVGYRGFAKMRRAGLDPAGPHPIELLRRMDVDSVALHLEPTLRAWEIPYWILRPGEERAVIRSSWFRAHDEERPVAVLVPSPLRHG